jgi:hypothetical protein
MMTLAAISTRRTEPIVSIGTPARPVETSMGFSPCVEPETVQRRSIVLTVVERVGGQSTKTRAGSAQILSRIGADLTHWTMAHCNMDSIIRAEAQTEDRPWPHEQD